MADQIDIEIERLRAEWTAGHYPSLIEAFRWCVLNERCLPEWIADAVHGALWFTALEGGRNGRGKTGGFQAASRRSEVDDTRWGAAERALQMRDLLPNLGDFAANRDGAFEYASRQLAGTPAQGSADAIKRSHQKVQRRNRCVNSPK